MNPIVRYEMEPLKKTAKNNAYEPYINYVVVMIGEKNSLTQVLKSLTNLPLLDGFIILATIEVLISRYNIAYTF